MQDYDITAKVDVTYGLVWSENDSADDNTEAQLLQLHFHRIAPLHCTNYELLRFGARLSRLMIAGARLHSINLQLTQTGEGRQFTDEQCAQLHTGMNLIAATDIIQMLHFQCTMQVTKLL